MRRILVGSLGRWAIHHEKAGTLSLRASLNVRLRQGLVSPLSDDAVTFTCRLFETVSINDLDIASVIADELFSLKHGGEHCNSRSSHPEHL